MKLLLTSALIIVSAASAATVEKPYELSPEEITFLANTPCDGRGNRKWCTNGWGDFTCEWNRSRCKEVKSSSDCEDNGWSDCQSDSSCKWKSSNGRGHGRCVRNEVDCDDLDWRGCQGESECKWKSSNGRGRGRCIDNKRSDDCDGVATSRKQDCKDYCKSGPGSERSGWGYHWSYDRNSYKCTCDNGRVCKSPRDEGDEDEFSVHPRKEGEMIGTNDLLDADVTELWDYEDSEEFVDSEDSKIDWGNAWNKTKSGTKEAARRTAEGGKKAADKTKEWGKKTFKPDSPAATMSSMFGIVSLGLASVLYHVVA